MLKINDRILMDIAKSYESYIRGRQYYESGRVSNVKFNKECTRFKGIVRGNENYEVSAVFDSMGNLLSSSCTCPAYAKYSGDCKHIIAFLLKIKEFESMGAFGERIDKNSAKNIIEYYRDKDEEEKVSVNIECEYEFNMKPYQKVGESSYLNLKIGEDRLYVVKNIKGFLRSLETGEDINFGKNFKFSPQIHKFKDEDMGIINFLRLLYENYEINYSEYGFKKENIFRNQKVLLTPIALKSFFSLMNGQKFNADIMGRKYENITIMEDDLLFNIKIKGKNSDLIIDINSEEDTFPLTSDGEYFFHRNQIYRISQEQKESIIPLYNEIMHSKNGILRIPEQYKEDFISEVLPNIKNKVNLDIDKKVEDAIYSPEFKCDIYFDRQDEVILGKVSFIYEDIIINPFSSRMDVSVNKERILLRDREKEKHIFKLLEEGDFKVIDGGIYIDKEEKIFDFIYEVIPKLQECCNIYYSESFKGLSIKNSSYFSGGIKLNKKLNMLEFNFEIDGIDSKELEQVFKSIKEKKKYFRLKDGSFLPLDNKELMDVRNIAEYFGTDKRKFKNGTMTIHRFNSICLNNFLKEKGLNFVKEDDNFKKLVQDINEPNDIEYEIPAELKGILRDYQKFGFKWLKTLSKYGFGGILADDMGLGKTLQIITFLLSEKREKGPMPSLIIAPTSLVYNWEEEVRKFTSDLKVLIIVGNKPGRKELIKSLGDYDMVITSYPLIRRDIDLYQKFEFRCCILDEAQHIKNYRSLNANSVKKIKANNYFALTGTPMENSLIELWSIFDFLMPGYLLSNRKFLEKYEKPIVKGQDERTLDDLNNRIKPFILRRLKKDVLKELPDKIEQRIVVDMTKEQKKIYLAYLKSIRGEIEKEIKDKGFNKSQIKILAGLTRLRQICCHPAIFIENYTGESGKLNSLEEILKDAIDGGRRILLFSQFTTMLGIIKTMLEKNNISYMYLDGSVIPQERGNLVREFNEGVGKVFLISLKAGGTGLNLIGADMVIHFDPWWNPAVEEQATDRAYRIGQKNTVQVIKLVTKGTIKEKIFKLQERKKEIIDKVIVEGETLISKMSQDEISYLFES
ncbi:DEAD/DEAH box helicase [Sporanaerobacter sp. PP17-6a]|uniref:DEAD/DEAH box helicase n=1 Tax=Sporanaerobacter sp. PP17-6a TaxID=1891289 RepID=UPI00089FF951|nr:DEAD/DEAH box helicase [Sporanaerobacter sp. PP17-6a]SCL96674.1 ATP-dependent helicase HepA [Sporanaerobacter sp. PP17-6a]